MHSEAELALMTPMLKQYFMLKAQQPDAILFFRMGDFYELFGDDAEEIAHKLEIVLTSRERGDDKRIKFCGVPHHSVKNYLLKLLKMNYRVAIAEQVEDVATAKGLVKREIVKVLSPGCIDDIEGLEGDKPNYLIGVFENPKNCKLAICLADFSTGEIRLGNVKDMEGLYETLEEFNPKELFARAFFLSEAKQKVAKYTIHHPLLFGEFAESILRDELGQKKLMTEVFGNHLKNMVPLLSQVEGGQQVVCGILEHLQRMKLSLKPFMTIKPLHQQEEMVLNEIALRDLEIFTTVRRQDQRGSLFYQLNHCLTPMGARLLRFRLSHPFVQKDKIILHQEQVGIFFSFGASKLQNLRQILDTSFDLERLSTRVLTLNAKPQELCRLRNTVKKALELSNWLKQEKEFVYYKGFAQLIDALSLGNETNLLLEKALKFDPQNLGEGDQIFASGYCETLDRLVELSINGQSKVDAYQDKLREETDISSLKIKAHKSLGLLIEVTKSHLHKVPKHFIRKQTMVGGERFVTDELKNLEEILVSAKDQAIEHEQKLYLEILEKIAVHHPLLLRVANALASLDLLQSFAWVALKEGYCRPKFNSGVIIQLIKARHPVVESFVGKHQFVPNDVFLSSEQKHMLLTGPNMAGKSTSMRQVALCAVLAQVGSFVPAEQADLPIFDQIYTRVGASDDLSQGLSTFMVEMTEASYILRHATENSLVILDEIGRGTSSEDGLAIAEGILQYLVQKVGSWSFFATHFHELVHLAENLKSVRVVQTEVLEKDHGIVFTHRLIPGYCRSSFGIEVAKLAGLPEEVLVKAKDLLKIRINQATYKMTAPIQSSLEESLRPPVESVVEYKILERLERVSINRTTPMQALSILNELKEFMLPAPIKTSTNSSLKSLFHDGQM